MPVSQEVAALIMFLGAAVAGQTFAQYAHAVLSGAQFATVPVES